MRIKEREINQANYLSEHNVNKSIDVMYNDQLLNKCIRFIADEINRNIYISITSNSFDKIPFSDVIGCEIVEDSQVTGGVKRAVVGGVVAGEAGAVVGAVTAKKKVSSYKVVLFLSTLNKPMYELPIITGAVEISTESTGYKNAVDFAQKINAAVKAVLSNNEKHERRYSVTNNGAIRKLKREPYLPKKH